MPPSLTIYFIVEPPDYQLMACYLAASIREQFGKAVKLVGYCPEQKLDSVQADVKQALRLMDVDLRGFATEGRFDPPYPHGNKLLATLEPRDTDFSCFMDSDILCLRPNRVENIVREGHVTLSKAASMNWAPQSIWDRIYATCGMELPSERFKLMKQRKGQERVPYFSSGLFSFPERHRNAEGLTFPQVWMQVAQRIDADPDLPKKRPYLDQMSMPLAIRKAGLDWNLLGDEQHFILGGRERGKPLPTDREIFTVHYRIWDIVKETGLSRQAKDMLERHAGVRRLAQFSKQH
ncbi:hypothetical protein G5B31_11250 [Rhodobacter sp. SGA-6-6]|uniref:hypothetical protein n=1 Tax=Rhodobacter sp. SGA-6-6 TaxID=2710882 RepID=UPI0013EB5B27|nr:hypothetical protein [Rhodobacter sp. SGA-6-6]NGM46112.1 hypothetical protein [Rhodobacter sp. SGA-6-6]